MLPFQDGLGSAPASSYCMAQIKASDPAEFLLDNLSLQSTAILCKFVSV